MQIVMKYTVKNLIVLISQLVKLLCEQCELYKNEDTPITSPELLQSAMRCVDTHVLLKSAFVLLCALGLL